MKFLEKLAKKYDGLEVAKPSWLKEAATGVGMPITPTGTSGATLTPTGTTTVKAPAKTVDVSQLTNNPDVQRIKKETDTMLKQVAELLKKKAQEALTQAKSTQGLQPTQ